MHREEEKVLFRGDCPSYGRWLMLSGGRLVIRPGHIDYDTYAKIRHRGPGVDVVHTRLPLLLAPTTIKLEGEDGELAFVWPLFRRGNVIRALEQSGVQIRHRSAWFLPCFARKR